MTASPIDQEFAATRRRLDPLALDEGRPAEVRRWRRLEEAVVFAIEDGEADAARSALAAWEDFARSVLRRVLRARSDNTLPHLGAKAAAKSDEKGRGA